MSDPRAVNWQPIGMAPVIADLIDRALKDARTQFTMLSEAKPQPHVLDDATLDHVDRVHKEQLQFVDIYDQQITRWRAETPTPAQSGKLDRTVEQNQKLRAVTMDILALSSELRKGSIDRIMEMSDLELGLQALLGGMHAKRF